MREAEQVKPLLPLGADRLAAPVWSKQIMRALAGASVLLVALNLLLSIWYAAVTGDASQLLSHQLLTPFLSLANAYLGVLVIRSRPRNPIGWIFLTVGLSYGLSALAGGVYQYGPTLGMPPALLNTASWMTNWVWLPAQILPLTFVFLLFPDGRLLSRRWRPVAWASGVGLALLMVGLASHPGPLSDWGTVANPFGMAGMERPIEVLISLGGALLAFSLLGSVAAVVVRFRRSQGPERAQMKWLAYAAGVIFLLAIPMVWLWLSGALNSEWGTELSIVLTNLCTLAISAAATLAIVSYRLYDIDILINRTLVYAVMTGVVLLIYALVVGAAGALLGTQGNSLLTLLATGLVAVLFQPIYRELQQGVNRLLYGQRDEPFEVLAGLGQRLEQSLTPEAVYPAIVETVAQALRLPYVAIRVPDEPAYRTVEAYGRPVAGTATFLLNHQGAVVGQLVVGLRPSEDSFAPADERLLRNIARQAGAAVYGAKLTADLQRSRQQIVASREEERRRLRRDLHDGLGPALASLLLEARVMRRMVRSDPDAAERLAGEMQGDIRATIDDIRRIVYELRPPALDDLGLVPALNVLAEKIGRRESGDNDLSPPRVRVEAPDDLPALPAAVEVAAYRIVQEALTNVVRHAGAKGAVVTLRLDHDLIVEVVDDGVGFGHGREGGLGLHSMQERASELGGSCTVSSGPGGTVVRATLPVGGAAA